MTLNFPSSPTVGLTYEAPNGLSYNYDGVKWTSSGTYSSSTTAQQYKIDDISSDFNGSTTTFNLHHNSIDISVTSALDLTISIGGVLQEPETAYTVNPTASTITFSEAPETGTTFFGILKSKLADSNNTVSDGAIVTSKLADDSVNSAKIIDGSIVNADVNSSAAIDATKLSFTQTGTGAVARTVDSRLKDRFSVKDFGAVGDGSNDDTSEIQLALDAAGATSTKQTVYLPAGTYKITNRLSIPQNVSFVGAGMGNTIIDTSTATYSGFSSMEGSTKSVIHTALPTYTQVSDPSGNISRNVKSFAVTSISSPAAIAEGDIIQIFNPTDSSWSGWRTYYYAGEMLKVSDIDSTTLYFESSVVDDYTAADVDIYKVTHGQQKLEGFTVLMNPAGGSTARGVTMYGCKHSVIRDVEVLNAPYIGISVKECYDVAVERCHATDNHLESDGEYGLIIGNSQIVKVNGCQFSSKRHGLATGGGSNKPGAISCRFMTFTNNNISCSDAASGGDVQAFNLHGNAEYVTITGNTIDGGCNVAGDYTTWVGNTIYGRSQNGSCIYGTELMGLNHLFSNNIIKSTMQDTERGTFFDFGGNSDVYVTGKSMHGGTFVISGNNLVFDNLSNTSVQNHSILFKNSSFAGNEKIRLDISNNTSIAQQVEADNDEWVLNNAITIEWGAGNPWDEVNICNNTMHGGYYLKETGSDPEIAYQKVYIHNNNFRNGYYANATGVNEILSVKGNVFDRLEQYSGSVGESTDSDNTDYWTNIVHFSDNTFKDCMWGYNSSSSTRSTVYISRAQNAYVSNNIIVGNPVKINMDQDIGGLAASHEPGDIITGGTSGKYATVWGEQGNYLHIGSTARTGSTMFPDGTVDSYTGDWTDGETVTSSGRTNTTIDGATPVNTRSYSYAYSRVLNLHEYNNIDEAGLDNRYYEVTNGGGALVFGGNMLEKTIASGAITVTGSYHTVDTESDASSDDLDTINGAQKGQILTLMAASSSRTVVVKDGTNIKTAGDFSLTHIEDTITLLYTGTYWRELSRSDNGT